MLILHKKSVNYFTNLKQVTVCPLYYIMLK